MFGTDGIRGTPGVYPLTNEMLAKIAETVSRIILENKKSRIRCKIIIGKDTRLSGSHIENTLAKTFSQHGIDVFLSGIITTPGLSYLVEAKNADMGIMISASHNKPADNGVKFFNAKGYKLSFAEEKQIEKILLKQNPKDLAKLSPKRKGKVQALKNAQSLYTKFLTSTVKGLDLKSIRIALDCAWGSASPFAEKIFKQLKATVYSIHDKPHGKNINLGGAIQPNFLKQLVLRTGADIGIALDGDADRVILINEKGHILDGDYILAIMANYFLKNDRLSKNTVVTTVMSNLGLRKFLEEIGASAIFTSVGDKHVLEALVKGNLNLGGEQSGHIIFLEHLPTPDGLLTSLQVLKVMKDTGLSLSELSQCITKFPQVLVNVRVRKKMPFEDMAAVSEKLQYFQAQLRDQGRIFLRYSGTEPLARVMVEGRDKALVKNIAQSLARQIKTELG